MMCGLQVAAHAHAARWHIAFKSLPEHNRTLCQATDDTSEASQVGTLAVYLSTALHNSL